MEIFSMKTNLSSCQKPNNCLATYKKTGTSQVGAISKAQIKSKGDPLETKNIFKKKSHSAEKKSKGDLLVPSGFVGYPKKVKNQRGPFGTT